MLISHSTSLIPSQLFFACRKKKLFTVSKKKVGMAEFKATMLATVYTVKKL